MSASCIFLAILVAIVASVVGLIIGAWLYFLFRDPETEAYQRGWAEGFDDGSRAWPQTPENRARSVG